jgi:enolase
MATAIEGKACNALLLKVNQIGSITEAIEAGAYTRPLFSST